MLKELKVENFRIFDDEVGVRFKPITILIGRNSAGKTSIIKFLLMLQQSGFGYRQYLNPEGERVHLGEFSGLKNSLTSKSRLKFKLNLDESFSDIGDVLVELDSPVARYMKSRGLAVPDNLLYQAAATVSYIGRGSSGKANYSAIDESTGEEALRIDSDIVGGSSFLMVEHDSESWDDSKSSSEVFQPDESREASEKRIEDRLAFLVRMTAEIGVLSNIRLQINSMRHLPAVRAESARVILVSHPSSDHVGFRGENTLAHLQEMVLEDRDRYEFISPHLRNIAGIESVEFKTSSSYVSEAFAVNKLTGGKVLIADYGFGVSQCLPVIVQGAIMQPYTSFLVEQPEAQLHPTAQLEMGSFFAALWNERQVGSVIETHSGNILLRLRRLIAKRELSHGAVSVAYFTHDEDNNMPTIKNLDINEDGSLQPGLPMEFFGADVIEGLSLGARQ